MKLPSPTKSTTRSQLDLAPGDRFTQGFMDELFITRQPLTQNDVQNHFAGGIQGVLSVEPGNKIATRWGTLKDVGSTNIASRLP